MPIRSPKEINKGLEGWYDASETSSLQLSGSNLTGWLDLSGTGNNLDTIQGIAPQLSTRKINNKTAVEFNNDGAIYQTALSGTSTPESTIAFVCIPDIGDGAVVSSRTTLDNRVYISSNCAVSVFGSSSSSFTSNVRCKTGEVTRIIASFNGDSSKVWVNGVPTTTPAGFIEDRIQICMIGAAGVGDTVYFDGLVGEVAIYENALTDDEAKELDWYFQRKWDPFSNKVTFDTSANGYSFTAISDSSVNSTLTVNVPTNISNGDFMLGIIHCGGALNPGTLVPPAGWTQLANNFSASGQFTTHTWVGYRIANTEPVSYQWTIGASGGDDLGWIFRITGHDRRNPIDSIGSFSTIGFGTNAPVSPFTTSNNDTMVVYIFGGENGNKLKANGTIVSPNGTTQVVHQRTRTFSSAVGTSVAYEYKTFAGNTGSKIFTPYTSTEYFETFGFAIKQAPYSTVQAERLVETGKVKRFTDDFNRADTSSGDLGPNWDIIRTGLRIINNRFESLASFSYAKVADQIVDFSDDHSAQITVRAIGEPMGPAVRVNTNGCYTLYCDGGDFTDRRIAYISGGVRTAIGTINIVPVPGDTLKITVQGSTITAYKNGIQVDQISNTAYTTGQPGIFYNRSNLNESKGDDFIAEDLNSPTSGTMVKMFEDGTLQAGYFSEKEYLDRIKYHFDGDVWAGKFIESE